MNLHLPHNSATYVMIIIFIFVALVLMKTLIKNPRTALTLKTVRFDAVIDNSAADTIALALILEKISRGPRTALLELAQVEFDEQQYTDALCYAVSYACDRASAVKISDELRIDRSGRQDRRRHRGGKNAQHWALDCVGAGKGRL